ncbi:hypothetical protein [Nonomuraea sp. NPDC052265]|uniref:hypothetical protein n=1 Tax=Nonomuraea sp. NPDC052265 TaxID=3364374 RepID=UPI0037CA1506
MDGLLKARGRRAVGDEAAGGGTGKAGAGAAPGMRAGGLRETDGESMKILQPIRCRATIPARKHFSRQSHGTRVAASSNVLFQWTIGSIPRDA